MIHKNTHIIYITHVLIHIIYITPMIKLIFKAYKKTDKFFFIIFFLYIKCSQDITKNKEKLYKKAREKYQNLSEEEKSKKR